jgi:hypothetical protein
VWLANIVLLKEKIEKAHSGNNLFTTKLNLVIHFTKYHSYLKQMPLKMTFFTYGL